MLKVRDFLFFLEVSTEAVALLFIFLTFTKSVLMDFVLSNLLI